MSEYAKKTVADLTEILKSRGLPHSGKKADLVARLQESDKSTEAAAQEPEAATETTPAHAKAPSEPASTPASRPVPLPTSVPSEPSKHSEPAAEPAAEPSAEPTAASPDTTLAATTNYALNLPSESLDEEAARRRKRAERFGISVSANGDADDDEAKKVERAKKFGANELGLGKLNEALPTERERGPKRRKEGNDTAMDDPGLIRRGGGGGRGGRGGLRGQFRGDRSGSRGGRRQGTPDRPMGVQKTTAHSTDKDRAAAEARKKRFAAVS